MAQDFLLWTIGWLAAGAALCWTAARTAEPGWRRLTACLVTGAATAATVLPPLLLYLEQANAATFAKQGLLATAGTSDPRWLTMLLAGLLVHGFVLGPLRLAITGQSTLPPEIFAGAVAVTPALAVHGLLTIGMPLWNGASLRLEPAALLPIPVAAIVAGGAASLGQNRYARLLACLALSGQAWILLGIATQSPSGWTGAIRQAVTHGAAATMLLIAAGTALSRRPGASISDFGGLAHMAPHLTSGFLLAIACAAGVPLLGGFAGLFAILQGAVQTMPFSLALLLPGWLLAAAALAGVFRRTMLGEVADAANLEFVDLARRERFPFLPLALLALLVGLLPPAWMSAIEKQIQPATKQTAIRKQILSGEQDVSRPDQSK
jgi:hypothetical protein